MFTITSKTDTSRHILPVDSTFDSAWLKSTFIIRDSDLVAGDEYAKFVKTNRYYTTADSKFTSTAPGMSMAVNPIPQFTRYADIRSPGRLSSRPGDSLGRGASGNDLDVRTTGAPGGFGLGMGHYYSEAIDDNQQRIYLRFGVPSYTNLLFWITRSFDIDKAILQNRGVITTVFLEAVGVVATVFAIAAAPLFAGVALLVGGFIDNSRFYGFKETMYIYWSTVETIMNAMIARRTLAPAVFTDFSFAIDSKMQRGQSIDKTFLTNINEVMPGLVDPETGRISVFTIALKAQAAYNKMLLADLELSKTEDPSKDFTGYADKGNPTHDGYFHHSNGKATWFTQRIFANAARLLGVTPEEENSMSSPTTETDVTGNLVEMDPFTLDVNGNPLSLVIDENDPTQSVDSIIQDNAKAKAPTMTRYKEYTLASLSDGGMFAVFNVNSTGSVGESFSNSTTGNPIESTFNSLSSKSRNITNIMKSATDFPIVGEMIGLAADTVSMIASKASFGLANPILALAYGVNVSMPKVWDSSSASLPRASYSFKLISPYGNAYSQLFNIYLPLAMLLAGSLPRSTGNSSYTAPFLCQLFDRGRVNIHLGVIDSLSITRGTSNLPFSRAGHPNAIDVDISVANLDEIIAVDVTQNGVISKAVKALSPNFADTPMTTYLNTVTGVDVFTQIYRVPMMRLKLAERAMAIKAVTNPDPAALAAFTVENMPGFKLFQGIIGNNSQALGQLKDQGS
ncbi:putative virion associated protein [Bacillus phage vB_BspM_AgentSmith]|nr:putative virion associated protein [Bacillus phage vB_BspM_AgentSmith]